MKNRKPSLPLSQLKWLGNPWLHFLFFCAANFLLAYVSGSLTFRLCVGFYGIFLPAVVFSSWNFLNPSGRNPKRSSGLADSALLSEPSRLLWIAFLLLVLFTRFYRIASNPFWPIKDVGHFGILGMALSQKWDWRLLWGESQAEPLYLWGLGFFYKWVGPSSFSTRLFPALLSILSILLSYWASRQFFSKALSLASALFFTLTFQTWVFSRTGMGPDMVWPVEFLALGLLGKLFKEGPKPGPWLFLLGITVGLGFYTYTAWPVVFLALTIAVLFKTLKPPRHWREFFQYLLPAFVIAFPMLRAHLGQGGLHHLRDELLGLPLTQSIPGYWSLLFWNGTGSFPDGPAWGGLLNPVEGGLVFLGLLGLAAQPSSKVSQWVFLSLTLFVLPGVLCNTIGMDHIIQLLPLLLFPLVLGLGELLKAVSSSTRWPLLAALLFLSSLLSAYHWWGPYQDWKSLPPEKGDWIAMEYARAYGLLLEKNRQDGPLYVFSEFELNNFNKTLNVFCFPFDALQNPKLSDAHPHWAALLINKYYIPFLQKRFPDSQWEVLKKDDLLYRSNLALGFIPVASINPGTLDDWIKADHVCRDLNLEIKEKTPPLSWNDFRNELGADYIAFGKDPLLRSVYWEKTAMLDVLQSRDGDSIHDFQMALGSGYPAAHLYYNLSRLQLAAGLPGESQKNLKKAVEAQKALPVP